MLKKQGRAFSIYCIAFVVLLGVLGLWFLSTGLTFVRNGDAVTQHYPAFLYIGKYWREFFTGFVQGDFVPKMWDFSIGYGSDVIQTLTYYSLFDWTTIIFAFFSNADNGTVLYTAMMLFRTFLSGIAFILFCRKMKCETSWSFIAAFAYVLCPYMLDNVFNGHHYFGLPFLYLPLILIGIERILDDELDLLYPIVIALSITGQYYFFYMEMAFATLWFICRHLSKKYDLRKFIRNVLRYIGLTSIGVMISMPVIFPQLMALLSDFRANGKMAVHLLYSDGTYEKVLGNLLTSDTFSLYSYVGISPCILIGVFGMLIGKRGGWLKIVWLITFISTLFPYTGYAMNGFSYVTNRHSWLLAFISCFAFVLWADEIKEKINLGILVVASVYVAAVLLLWSSYPDQKELQWALLLFVVGLACFCFPIPVRWKEVMMVVCVGAGIFLHVNSVFIEDGGGY